MTYSPCFYIADVVICFGGRNELQSERDTARFNSIQKKGTRACHTEKSVAEKHKIRIIRRTLRPRCKVLRTLGYASLYRVHFHLIEHPMDGTGSMLNARPARVSSIAVLKSWCVAFSGSCQLSSMRPLYASLRARSKTKISGVHAASYARATTCVSSCRYGKGK